MISTQTWDHFLGTLRNWIRSEYLSGAYDGSWRTWNPAFCLHIVFNSNVKYKPRLSTSSRHCCHCLPVLLDVRNNLFITAKQFFMNSFLERACLYVCYRCDAHLQHCSLVFLEVFYAGRGTSLANKHVIGVEGNQLWLPHLETDTAFMKPFTTNRTQQLHQTEITLFPAIAWSVFCKF